MLPERVIWTEGMGVSPVHFQQQDRHVDAQLRMRGAMLKPHAWGFTEFLIDEQYLSLGKVVLSKAAGMLPDGTLFEIGHGQPPLSLDIAPGLTGKRIMLALPMAVEGGAETRTRKPRGFPPAISARPSASATTMPTRRKTAARRASSAGASTCA